VTDPQFLIDTNIAIYVLNDAASPAALRLATKDVGSVAISAIAYAEVMRGIPSSEIEALASARNLFELVIVQPFDAAAALAYARLPFRRGSFDRLIAAHALALGLTLVTNNEGDFGDIPGLRVENWAA